MLASRLVFLAASCATLFPACMTRQEIRAHLWENNGTWWVHFTEHLPDFTKRRVRRSLGTKDPAEAIRRRDALLAQAPRAA